MFPQNVRAIYPLITVVEQADCDLHGARLQLLLVDEKWQNE